MSKSKPSKSPSAPQNEPASKDKKNADVCPDEKKFEVSKKYGKQRSMTVSWANDKILDTVANGRSLGVFINNAIQLYAKRFYRDQVPDEWLQENIENDEFTKMDKLLLILLGRSILKDEELKKMLLCLYDGGITPESINARNLRRLCVKYSKESGLYDNKNEGAYWLIPLYMVQMGQDKKFIASLNDENA